MADPKVSVSLITYNHAKFIAQAIESILMQETDFEYELIIGEDDSSDGTREIVKAYKEQYPDKIKLLLNDRENVIYIDGRPTGRWNFINTLQYCTGQYIALLEGDDYWTDPRKLQKQVDLLDSHLEYAMCFHNVQRMYQSKKNKPVLFNSPFTIKKKYQLRDLLKGNFIHTSSVMYRNKLFGEFPNWFYTVAVGDWPLFILNAQYGNIGYLNEIMSVYRIHGDSVHSSRKRIDISQDMIEIYEIVNPHLNFKYDQVIQSAICLHRYYIAKDKGCWIKAILNLFCCIAVSPFNSAITYRRLFVVLQYYVARYTFRNST